MALSTANFKRIITEESDLYVDKSMFIKAVFDSKHFPLVTAPRKFCKSTNMDMLKDFVEIEINEMGIPIQLQRDENGLLLGEQENSRNYYLFKGLKISEEKSYFDQHFGRYAVMHMNFSKLNGTVIDQCLKQLALLVKNTFCQHKYMLKTSWLSSPFQEITKEKFKNFSDIMSHPNLIDADILTDGLTFLAETLHEYYKSCLGDVFKGVFFLMDEIDIPISTCFYKGNIDEIKKIADMMKTVLGETLKHSAHAERALLTACHHVAGTLTESANNVEHYTFLSSFAPYNGFTDDEVNQILEKHNLMNEMKNVEAYYNGFLAEKNGKIIKIFNNWSFFKFLKSKKLVEHWSVGYFPYIQEAFQINKIMKKMLLLLSGEELEITYVGKLHVKNLVALRKILSESPLEISEPETDLFFQFLYENGLLNKMDVDTFTIKVSIPNDEISKFFVSNLYNSQFLENYVGFSESNLNEYCKSVKNLLENVTRDAVKTVAKSIKNMFPKDNKIRVEEGLKVVLVGVLKVKTYGVLDVMPDLTTKKGKKPDCVAIHKQLKKGLSMEMKFKRHETDEVNSSERGFEQFMTRQYYQVLDEQEIDFENQILTSVSMDWRNEVSIIYATRNESGGIIVHEKVETSTD